MQLNSKARKGCESNCLLHLEKAFVRVAHSAICSVVEAEVEVATRSLSVNVTLRRSWEVPDQSNFTKLSILINTLVITKECLPF